MAIIPRKHQKIFAKNTNAVDQFGTAQDQTNISSKDLDVLQANAYEAGWEDAVISGERLPTMEEFNALEYIDTTQLSYIFQEGIPGYSEECEYRIGSIVKEEGSTLLYRSKTDNNINNPLSDSVYWENLNTINSFNVYNVAHLGGLAQTIATANGSSGYLFFPPGSYDPGNVTEIPANLVAWFAPNALLTSSENRVITFINPVKWEKSFINIDKITPVWSVNQLVNTKMFNIVSDANYFDNGSWYVDEALTTPATNNGNKILKVLNTVSDNELIIDGSYYTTTDLVFPKKIKGLGWAKSKIVGSSIGYINHVEGQLSSLRCTMLTLASCWNCKIKDIYTDSLFKIGKSGSTTGFELNLIDNVRAEGDGITIDNTYEYINLNFYERLDAQGTSEKPGLLLTGTGTNDMHSNTFKGDFAGSLGVVNNSEVNQWNTIIPYIESGANIVGNWHIISCQNDSNGDLLSINPNSVNIMNMYTSERTGDHFPLATNSFLPWDNIQGNNPEFLTSTGFSGLIIANEYEPTGLGYYFGGTTALDNTYIDITLPAIKEGYGVLNGYLYAGSSISNIDGFDVIRDYPSDVTSYNIHTAAYRGNGWYYLSVPFKANSGDNTILRLFINNGHTISKTVGWGNLVITKGKIGQRPVTDSNVKVLNKSIKLNNNIINYSKYNQSYVNSASPNNYFTHSFVFDKPYTTASSIVINISLENANSTASIGTVNYQISNITTTGFDLKVYYTLDYGGYVGYSSIGY